MARRQGSIQRLGDGRWLIRFYTGTTNGKRGYYSEVVRGTRKQAAEKLTEKLHEHARGVHVRRTKETLDEFLDRWEKDVATRVSEKTVGVYRNLLATHIRPVLGAAELQRLDTRAVQELVNEMSERVGRKLAPKTVREVYRVLRQALAKAVRWELIARNPTDFVELPKGSARGKRPFSADEVGRFREVARGTHHELIFDVLLTSGMRPGEALGLRWVDLDLDAGTARIERAVTEDGQRKLIIGPPKTQKSKRTVALPPPVVAKLRQRRAEQREYMLRRGPRYDRESGLVFATWGGGPVDHRNLRRAYLRLCRAAGIEGARGTYDLRHTAATLLIDAGVPIKAVSERLGHANVGITLGTYVHTTPGQHDQATAVLGALVE